MNTITIAVICIIIFLAFIYQFGKRFILNSLVKAINKKDYDLVIKITDMDITKRLVGQFTRDLYRIRAFYLKKDIENFDSLLDEMIHREYKNQNEKNNFLEHYYHTFLLKGNQKYSQIFLQAIEDTKDEKFIIYNKQAYEVIFNKRSDLIDAMDKQMETKAFYGFPLGVTVYMIAIQYLYLNNYEMALIYFKNAIICFHPKAVYVPYVKEYIKKMEEIIQEEKHKIDESIKTY